MHISQIQTIITTLMLAVLMRPTESQSTVIKEVASRLLDSEEFDNTQDKMGLLVFKCNVTRVKALNEGYSVWLQTR
jgi:hypothetical protein